MKIVRLFSCLLLCTTFLCGAYAADLKSTAAISITSDTAANAKNIAFDEARRQIISEVLLPYANPEQLKEAVKNAETGTLTNLISESSIDGERLSDTTYSANITMIVDRKSAKNWMTENSIQNWLSDGVSEDVAIVQIIMTDKLAGWMEIQEIARNEDINLFTKYINGNQITVEIPTSSRTAFTIAVREKGWRFSNSDGVLKIWK